MTCTRGLEGGVDNGKVVFGNCSYNNLYDSDHFSLLCIAKHNTPFLGLFHPEIAHLTNLRSHLSLVDGIKKRSSEDGHFALQSFLSYETGSQLTPSFPFQVGYRYGLPIRYQSFNITIADPPTGTYLMTLGRWQHLCRQSN